MMQTTFELALRPRPLASETLLGYALRVANTNGYESTHSVRELCNFTNTHMENLRYSSSLYHDIIAALSLRLRLSNESLTAAFDDEDGSYINVNEYVQCMIYTPRVCLGCLAEDHPVKRSWRKARMTHCIAHQQPLMSACPYCNHSFKWSPSLLTHCNHCDTPWQVDMTLQESVPAHVQHELTLPPAKRVEYVKMLHIGAAHAMRFDDMHYDPRDTLPSDIESLTALFTFSFRLITDSTFRDVHLHQRVDHWIKRGNFEVLNAKSLALFNQLLLASGRGTEQTPCAQAPQKAEQCFFQTKQVGYIRQSIAITPTDLNFQLTVSDAANLLGLDYGDVSAMAHLTLIKPLINPSSPRQFHVDARDIDALLLRLKKRLSSQPLTVATISVKDISVKLKRFKLGAADVFTRILNGQVAVYKPQHVLNSDLGELRVDRDNLLSHIETDFLDNLPNIVKRATILAYFFTSESQFEALKTHFKNELIHTENDKTDICVDSLKRFDTRYLVLNRYAVLRDLNPLTLYEALKKHDIHPAIRVMSTRSYYVYEKSLKLMATLKKLSHP